MNPVQKGIVCPAACSSKYLSTKVKKKTSLIDSIHLPRLHDCRNVWNVSDCSDRSVPRSDLKSETLHHFQAKGLLSYIVDHVELLSSLVNVWPQRADAAEKKIPLVKTCLVQDGQRKAVIVKKDRVAFCEDIQSDILPNGIVNVIERNVGSTANFYCNEGYLLDGNQSITCSQSRLNGETPQCRFHCGDIQSDSLPNGLVTLMERHVGSTANFSCNEGYLLDGNQSITCTQSGWNGETPQCRFQCKDIPPDSLTNGTVTVTERNVGSTANFPVTQDIQLLETSPLHAHNQDGMGTFHNVAANCNASGGQLTSIETNDENTFLLDVIALLKSIHEVRANFWIGLTDNNSEKTYIYISGCLVNHLTTVTGIKEDNRNQII
ncbi:unnamed protein product [Mytilus coruscus]|uniref:Sushi domain-containing protein n=1 Tax=Mytilus coruscus TaxID=42192 RepID=A0A6J8DSG7_MYTCO|nr:unnamed protein product [Mytilus coruscus]